MLLSYIDRLISIRAIHNSYRKHHTIFEVNYMNHEKGEKAEQKKMQEKFNNVTMSTKPENQNQNNNARKEGVGRQNNKFRDE